jgi:hypothetical protein
MNKFKFNLFAILIVSILFSCSTNEDEITREYTGLQISVDKIGSKSNVGKKVSQNLEKISKKNFNLNLNNIERSTYSYLNDIQYFLIPFENQKNKSLGFYSNGINQLYTIVESEIIDSENTLYRIYDIDNLPLHSFVVNSKKGLMNYQKQNSLDVSSLRVLSDHEYPADFNCGTLGFTDCIECGLDVCSQDWRCELAAIATGPAFAAGLAITCGLEQIDNP